MPLTILPDPPNTSPSGHYEGSIDAPNGEGLHSLPLTIQGWAAIRGSKNGTGVSAVEIWNGSREEGQFLAEASYGIYRPDVAQVLGDPRLASSGFYAQLHSLPAARSNFISTSATVRPATTFRPLSLSHQLHAVSR